MVVNERPFQDILSSQNSGKKIDEYLAQFVDDDGPVAWHDMASEFFGLNADVETVQRFVQLVSILHAVAEAGYEEVIIDVEPTGGFKRLILNSRKMVRSLSNLHNRRVALLMLSAAWPDIVAFLKGAYVTNVMHYNVRILNVLSAFSRAMYFVVTLPQKSPALQAGQVVHLIRSVQYRVSGIVVNGVAGKSYEAHAMGLLPPEIPQIHIPQFDELQGSDALPILERIGEILCAK